MTKVAGYIRVSTKGQAEHGGGLENQADTIREYCTANGLDLVDLYEDAGVSGANGIESRDALPELLGDLDAGLFEAVVIVRLDRLARDLMLQETIIADVVKRGGTLHSIAEPDLCSADPTRTMVRQIMGAIAQYEKALIVKRLAGGRRRKRRNQGYAGGWVPLGYSIDGDGRQARPEVDQAGAEVVRRVFAEYAAGASTRAIAEGLTADQVPTQRGGKWAAATVGTILGNPAYKGIEYPAIVDGALWDECSTRRQARNKRAGARA